MLCARLMAYSAAFCLVAWIVPRVSRPACLCMGDCQVTRIRLQKKSDGSMAVSVFTHEATSSAATCRLRCRIRTS